MSTLTPATMAAHGAQVAAAGGGFVDCPVGGTTMPARDGKLLGMAGGSAADFERARPVLERLCRRVDHVGTVGAGAAMKLAINLPLLVYWRALGEALSMAECAGIDRQLAAEILGDSNGAIPVAKTRLPRILSTMAGNPPDDATFAIAGSAKDLRLMVEVAAAHGFAVPAAATARQSYEAALADGWGERDFPLLAAWRFAQRSEA